MEQLRLLYTFLPMGTWRLGPNAHVVRENTNVFKIFHCEISAFWIDPATTCSNLKHLLYALLGEKDIFTAFEPVRCSRQTLSVVFSRPIKQTCCIDNIKLWLTSTTYSFIRMFRKHSGVRRWCYSIRMSNVFQAASQSICTREISAMASWCEVDQRLTNHSPNPLKRPRYSDVFPSSSTFIYCLVSHCPPTLKMKSNDLHFRIFIIL